MSTQVGSISPVAETSNSVARPMAGDVGGAALAQPAPTRAPADLRLVIEPDGGTGSYVYKTLDRRTGEIVNQFPREEVLRLKHDETYQAGDVIDAQV